MLENTATRITGQVMYTDEMNHLLGVKYKLELRGQTDATFRVKLNEAYPLRQVILYMSVTHIMRMTHNTRVNI